MNLPSSTTAILLFTRTAGGEAAYKRLAGHGGAAAGAAVAAQLIARATAVAQQAGVDFLRVEPAQQVGRTFGERLSGAMQQAFASGYEQLIVIGNDCPQLDAALLRRALATLAQTGAVLGPATDGGVYLLGVSRAYFDAGAWAALPWQTATLGRALGRQLRAAGATVPQLPLLADIDNEYDLAQALRLGLPRLLSRVLRWLRAAINPVPALNEARNLCLAWVLAQPHRGPPAC